MAIPPNPVAPACGLIDDAHGIRRPLPPSNALPHFGMVGQRRGARTAATAAAGHAHDRSRQTTTGRPRPIHVHGTSTAANAAPMLTTREIRPPSTCATPKSPSRRSRTRPQEPAQGRPDRNLPLHNPVRKGG